MKYKSYAIATRKCMTVNAIMEKDGTSRQIVGQDRNIKPNENTAAYALYVYAAVLHHH